MDLISAKQTFRDCINKLQEFESYINRDEINIELDKLKEIMNDAAVVEQALAGSPDKPAEDVTAADIPVSKVKVEVIK